MFPLPLVIEPGRSTHARACLLLAHLAALASLALAQLPVAALVAGGLLLASSLAWSGRRSPPLRLRAREDGSMERWRDGAWHPLQIDPDECVAQPWLIVLRWREAGRRHGLVLPADALPSGQHRRLRMWLRWNAGFSQATPPVESAHS